MDKIFKSDFKRLIWRRLIETERTLIFVKTRAYHRRIDCYLFSVVSSPRLRNFNHPTLKHYITLSRFVELCDMLFIFHDKLPDHYLCPNMCHWIDRRHNCLRRNYDFDHDFPEILVVHFAKPCTRKERKPCCKRQSNAILEDCERQTEIETVRTLQPLKKLEQQFRKVDSFLLLTRIKQLRHSLNKLPSRAVILGRVYHSFSYFTNIENWSTLWKENKHYTNSFSNYLQYSDMKRATYVLQIDANSNCGQN